MSRGLPDGRRSRVLVVAACALALALLGFGLRAFLESPAPLCMAANAPLDQLLSHQLIGYANVLLIGATVLYVLHFWLTGHSVGLWATGLSIAGALGLSAGLTVRAIEIYVLHDTQRGPLATLPEIISLFSALTVVIYLIMERAYRTRAAGAFVMPIVAAAVLFEASLAANDSAAYGGHTGLFLNYLIQIHVLANFMGYGAFVLAAVMSASYLLRHSLETRERTTGHPLHGLPDSSRIGRWVHLAMCVGFPLFSVAAALGAIVANAIWGRYWAWEPKEIWVLTVLAIYVSYFYMYHAKKWRDARIAWWNVIGFGLTALAYFGIALFVSGLHS